MRFETQMPLRAWQESCVSIALKKYRDGQQNFMCVAAPGAGKTRFSAALAMNLLHSNTIDFVVCLAPSIYVANNIQETFSAIINDRLDGKIGSKGLVVTYQGLQHSYTSLSHVIRNYRVMIISDEIHHCASGRYSPSNQWGELLASLISEGSPLTLTMSGTPWRSDNTKIALQNYLGEPEELHTDYIYGLSEAIQDRVCRKPNLILIDNSKIEVREANQTHKFCSIRHAVEADKLKYSNLITNKVALEYLIKCAHHELSRIRLESPEAAGLVVASSIEQANRISQYIKNKFNEHVTVVSYRRFSR